MAGVWVPFFTATNANGETHISPETLGYPVRLAKDKDGSLRLKDDGAPMLRTVKELADQVRLVRENFQAGLVAHAESVARAIPDAYKAQGEANRKAGQVVYDLDAKALADFVAEAQGDNAEAEAEAPAGEPVLAAA